MKISYPVRRIPIILGLLISILTSCGPVRLISDYDEITDKAVSALQEKVSRFFVQIESQISTNKATYENHKKFYEDVKVDIKSLSIRASAIDKNEIVQTQIGLLSQMTEDLEKLHKIGFSSTEQLKAVEQPFNAAFTAIIKLQLGLKRGKKANS